MMNPSPRPVAPFELMPCVSGVPLRLLPTAVKPPKLNGVAASSRVLALFTSFTRTDNCADSAPPPPARLRLPSIDAMTMIPLVYVFAGTVSVRFVIAVNAVNAVTALTGIDPELYPAFASMPKKRGAKSATES